MTASRRRPGALPAPSTDSAEAVGAYVTEVLTRLGDERDVLRTAMERIAHAEPSDSAVWLRQVAHDALRESRRRAS